MVRFCLLVPKEIQFDYQQEGVFRALKGRSTFIQGDWVIIEILSIARVIMALQAGAAIVSKLKRVGLEPVTHQYGVAQCPISRQPSGSLFEGYEAVFRLSFFDWLLEWTISFVFLIFPRLGQTRDSLFGQSFCFSSSPRLPKASATTSRMGTRKSLIVPAYIRKNRHYETERGTETN